MPYSNYYAGGNGIPYMSSMGGLGKFRPLIISSSLYDS